MLREERSLNQASKARKGARKGRTEDNALGASIVARGERAETLLTGRIPYTQLVAYGSNLDVFDLAIVRKKTCLRWILGQSQAGSETLQVDTARETKGASAAGT
jgi:hypothetical protein